MTIAVDLSVVQGPHRMRGIGYTLINLLSHMPEDVREKHDFVFYVLEKEAAEFDPLTILDLHNVNYEVRFITPARKIHKSLPGRLNLFVSALNRLLELRDLKFGDSRVHDLSGVDIFLQTDQSQSFPHNRKIKKVLVVYDIIPYTLEKDYLWSYRTAREVRGYSRKAALRCHVRRKIYAYKLKLNLKHADLLLAISEVTRRDFLKTFNIDPKKIKTAPLGVAIREISKVARAERSLKRYKNTSWGYMPYSFKLPVDKPFLLFVGGADRRRKLEDLVTAFNHLRANGHDINLVLVGDSMQGPEAIATEEIQGALKSSSYLEDIIFLGFTNDEERDWLYSQALAFVFPSRYEGFGLPVLEAMQYDCPVVCYPNEATLEVAADAPLYATSPNEIVKAIELLIEKPSVKKQMYSKGKAQVALYSWSKTAQNIFSFLVK